MQGPGEVSRPANSTPLPPCQAYGSVLSGHGEARSAGPACLRWAPLTGPPDRAAEGRGPGRQVAGGGERRAPRSGRRLTGAWERGLGGRGRAERCRPAPAPRRPPRAARTRHRAAGRGREAIGGGAGREAAGAEPRRR